jgi:hypothetical protein
MRTFEEIHTDRLLMRRWREADREPFAELNASSTRGSRTAARSSRT